jgi:hypothetical protein
MAIIKKPAPTSVEEFIKAAPDAGAQPTEGPRRVRKGNQVQISHALPAELLEALDAFVKRNPGLKRAGAINAAIRQMLEQGLTVQLRPVDQEDRA